MEPTTEESSEESSKEEGAASPREAVLPNPTVKKQVGKKKEKF